VPYVPIMRSKQGEIGALAVLTPAIKSQIRPLLDMTPRNDVGADDPRWTVSQHIERLIDRIIEAWQVEQPLFIDVAALSAIDDVDAPEALSLIAERCLWNNQGLAPVTAPERAQAYQAQVRRVVEEHQAGACLRLEESSFERPRALRSRIDRLLLACDLDPAQVHLVVDLRDGARPVIVETFLALLPRVDEWKELTLASGSFPATLQGVDQQRVPRHEMALWHRYMGDLEDDEETELRRPGFGDYGPVYAGTSDIVDVMYAPAPNLRYATPDSWIVLRGRGGPAAPGNSQMYNLCVDLVEFYRTEFRGTEFSWGDSWIFERAYGERPGPGNASIWIKVAFSHHLAETVNQLATPPAP
jgi:hypothetical protein